MSPGVASWLPTAIFVPLVGFMLYRRVRRTFGRQPVTPKRMGVRMVLLSVISVGFLVWMPTLNGFAATTIGLTLGVVLATYGLKHTTYDVTAAGAGYTPTPWIGLIVTALFLGRFAARMFSVYEARAGASPEPGGSPDPEPSAEPAHARGLLPHGQLLRRLLRGRAQEGADDGCRGCRGAGAMKVAKRDDWKIESMPDARTAIAYTRVFDSAEHARVIRGIVPEEMEDKWFVFYEAPWLWFHRSWTGFAIYAVKLRVMEVGSTVDETWVNRSPEQYRETDDAYDAELLSFLVERLLLGRDVRFPVRPSVEPDKAPLLVHHIVGHARSNED